MEIEGTRIASVGQRTVDANVPNSRCERLLDRARFHRPAGQRRRRRGPHLGADADRRGRRTSRPVRRHIVHADGDLVLRCDGDHGDHRDMWMVAFRQAGGAIAGRAPRRSLSQPGTGGRAPAASAAAAIRRRCAALAQRRWRRDGHARAGNARRARRHRGVGRHTVSPSAPATPRPEKPNSARRSGPVFVESPTCSTR